MLPSESWVLRQVQSLDLQPSLWTMIYCSTRSLACLRAYLLCRCVQSREGLLLKVCEHQERQAVAFPGNVCHELARSSNCPCCPAQGTRGNRLLWERLCRKRIYVLRIDANSRSASILSPAPLAWGLRRRDAVARYACARQAWVRRKHANRQYRQQVYMSVCAELFEHHESIHPR